MDALSRLYHRVDFRRNPLRAVVRRLMWHIRWAFISSLWKLKLPNGSRILVPKGGSGALIYYQGTSEPETIKLILDYLKPGMVFWDIGAHIGEFTILAARAVGENGRVHAFEPNPEIFEIMKKNVRMNNLENVILNPVAVTDQEGDLEMELYEEPSLSRLRSHSHKPMDELRKIIKVETVSLDSYSENYRNPDVIKIDVEGAELNVLRGMKRILQETADETPKVFFEFNPINYSNYGHDRSKLLSFMKEFGFSIYKYQDYHLEPANPQSLETTEGNLVALKDPYR